MEHYQSSYFCRALMIFAGALPPLVPPWWRGRTKVSLYTTMRELSDIKQRDQTDNARFYFKIQTEKVWSRSKFQSRSVSKPNFFFRSRAFCLGLSLDGLVPFNITGISAELRELFLDGTSQSSD